MEKMHAACRIEGKDAAAANLARLFIPELRRSQNDSVLSQEHTSGRLFRRGRMQAALKGEQDGFLALWRKLVQDARAPGPTIRKAVEVTGGVDRQCALGKFSYGSAIQVKEDRF